MALWICGRPANKCHPSEVEVAERLSRLNDDWIVAWGYRYGRSGAGVLREGDFLVQDPDGHTCVIEVKSGYLRSFALTGYWEHKEGDNPAEQLAAETNGVLDRLRAVADGKPIPFVHRTLALPGVAFAATDKFGGHLKQSEVLGRGDLDHFERWWRRHAVPSEVRCDAADARRLFLAAFGGGVTPQALEWFVSETDSLLLRAIAAEGRVLRQLEDNRQLLIQGGCGTGKTLLALIQARRRAESGKDVLLLVFNLPLAEQLAHVLGRRPPGNGRITVRSWEALTLGLLAELAQPATPPTEQAAMGVFWGETVPRTLLAAVDAGRIAPRHDVLVVDEAQDLDTTPPPDAPPRDGPFWWEIVTALLREGRSADVTAFHDPGQRPFFRNPAGFDPARLLAWFSQPGCFRLHAALRYTRPVYDYLAGLVFEDKTGPGSTLVPPDEFREGPAVEQVSARRGKTAEAVRDVLGRWVAQGLCRPEQVVILGLRRQRTASRLGHLDRLGDIPLADHAPEVPRGTVTYLNLHRAKGLDWLAVIVIDLPPRATLLATRDEPALANLFAAASRARQLLAVVEEAG